LSLTTSFFSVLLETQISCAQVARTAGPRIERGNQKGGDATTVEATARTCDGPPKPA
jgi:hypothetical protein